MPAQPRLEIQYITTGIHLMLAMLSHLQINRLVIQIRIPAGLRALFMKVVFEYFLDRIYVCLF